MVCIPDGVEGGRILIEGLALAKAARDAVLDKKGSNPVILDVKGLAGFTDYFVIASASNAPQLKAIFNEVQRVLKSVGVHCYRQCGDSESGWVVLDYVDVVIHVLSHEARRYYAIEELCPTAPRPTSAG